MNKQDMQMESILIQLQIQNEEIKDLKKNLDSNKIFDPIPMWSTLAQCAALKGGSTAKSLQHRPWQQPCCGTKYKKYNGVRVWHRDEVIKWLSVTDENLEAYALENGVDISRFFQNGKTLTK